MTGRDTTCPRCGLPTFDSRTSEQGYRHVYGDFVDCPGDVAAKAASGREATPERRHFLGSRRDGERAVRDLQQGKRGAMTWGHRPPWRPLWPNRRQP